MSKVKVAFILGSGHCGSTLLDVILSHHERIVGVGEIDVASSIDRCACGKKISDCPAYAGIAPLLDQDNSIFRNIKNFLINASDYEDVHGNQINLGEYLARQEEIYLNISRNTGRDLIVDSSKSVNRVEAILKRAERIDPVVIHMVRDGRAVLWSYYKKYQKIREPVFEWILRNLSIEILKFRSDIPSISISYGNLVKNPEKELGRIMRILGLEDIPPITEKETGSRHQARGNSMRLKVLREIREDKDWEENMPDRQKAVFNMLGGWLNFYYKWTFLTTFPKAR